MTEATAPAPGRWQRLVNGSANIDFIGRSRLWLYVVLGSIAVALLCLGLRGLNFGIDFTGGTSYTVVGATADFTGDDITDALAELGITDTVAQVVADGAGALVSAPALEEIGGDQQAAVVDVLAGVTGASPDEVDVSAVGPRWGAQVTQQALRGLVVFLVLVTLYIAVRFELRMAAAALVTLLHDIILTVGVYALVGFEVTPASVIAFLTILGYSLYDTVVVFDRVTEDTADLTSVSSTSYGLQANRALNEVLIRSLSTAVTSILPVGSLLFVGSTLLGAETLRDLALALFVGSAVGIYSSVIVATPFLVWLKEKEPRLAELKARATARKATA